MGCLPLTNNDNELIGFVCGGARGPFRLRLEDGGYVYMLWHNYMGPIFYKDKLCYYREITDWYENPVLCTAYEWFVNRGKKA